jgi:AcrR family transcriptional regulator
MSATETTPAVNQLELHPYLQQQELRALHAELGIVTEAWSPLGQGSLLDNPALTEIAHDRRLTTAEVVLAWHLQRGAAIIPARKTPAGSEPPSPPSTSPRSTTPTSPRSTSLTAADGWVRTPTSSTSSKDHAMTKPVTPYHHGNLRAELLICAERTLEQVGVAGLSLRALAREIGVSHGAPRQHFADKQALLDALAIHGLERLGNELDAGLGQVAGAFDERLIAFARIYVSFATRHPAMLALMFARKDNADRPALRAANDWAFAAPSTLIAEALDNGDLTGNDPDRVAMAVLATLQGLAAIITSGMIGDRPADSVITGTVEILVRGLRNPSDRCVTTVSP